MIFHACKQFEDSEDIATFTAISERVDYVLQQAMKINYRNTRKMSNSYETLMQSSNVN